MKKHNLRGGTSGDAVLLMLVKLATILLGFAVTRLLSQYLSVHDYGTYSQILLVVSTASSLTVLGMMDGVNYFYCSERDVRKRESYIATIFALQCVIGAVTGVAVLLLSGAICAYFENPDVRGLLIFGATLPLLQNLLGMLRILLVSVGKARMLAVRNLIVSLVRLAVALLVITVVRNVAAILLTTLALDVLQILFFGTVLRKNGCRIPVRSVDPRLVRQILYYCAPMAVFTVVNTLNRDLDKYLIALLTDTEAVAVYTNASKQLPFDIIATSFCTVLLPQITRLISDEDRHGAAARYKVFLEISYISTTILCCAALAGAPQLMMLLYSEKYISGLVVFCIYILVDMLRFTNITLILSAAGKTKTLMWLGGGALAMNAALNVVFFDWLGLVGPAVATLVTTATLGCVLLCLSAKELDVKLGEFFDGKYLLLFCLESGAAVFLFSRLRQWLADQGIHYFLILLAVCGSYCVVMLLLHGRRLLRNLKQLNRAPGGT